MGLFVSSHCRHPVYYIAVLLNISSLIFRLLFSNSFLPRMYTFFEGSIAVHSFHLSNCLMAFPAVRPANFVDWKPFVG